MRVLICGDRNWTDERAIRLAIDGLIQMAVSKSETLTIIHGAARGADSIAGRIAGDHAATKPARVEVIEFPAQWKKYGKKAGPLRNVQMLQEGKPDFVIAFHNDLSNSRGTLHMATISSKAGLDVYVVHQYAPV